jgi:hypothetical protein
MGASSFWYQAGVNAAGPLVTAVVGLLIVGLAVNRYTSASQDRKMDNEPSQSNEELRELRRRMLEQYPPSRARADVLEERLAAYFADPRVALVDSGRRIPYPPEDHRTADFRLSAEATPSFEKD